MDGFCTDQPDLTDEMYADASLHRENGAWQMIFGVNTIPTCRKKGYAGMLLQCAISDARAQGRKGLVLTCKEALVHYYAKFGFVNEGVRIHPRGRGVVPDAAEVLKKPSPLGQGGIVQREMTEEGNCRLMAPLIFFRKKGNKKSREPKFPGIFWR